MGLTENQIADLDRQLQERIEEMEANNEPREAIQAVIANFEASKRKLGVASVEEQRIESFKQRKEAEDTEKARKESMRFVNHGHITGEEIDKVNTGTQAGAVLPTGWLDHRTGVGDDSIIPKLQEVYGDDYEITNPSSWAESVKFESKTTGATETFNLSEIQWGHAPWNPDEMANELASNIASWVDQDINNITPEMVDKRTVNEANSEKISDAHIPGGGVDIIDKTVEGWNNPDEVGIGEAITQLTVTGAKQKKPALGIMGPLVGSYITKDDMKTGQMTTEEAFFAAKGHTGRWAAIKGQWRGDMVASDRVSTNNTVSGDRLNNIIDDLNTTIDEVMHEHYKKAGGTELEIEDKEGLYEEIFEKFMEDSKDKDYLLPKDQYHLLMGGSPAEGGVSKHLDKKILEHQYIFDRQYGDARLSNETKDQAYYDAVFKRDHKKSLTEGELVKFDLVAKAEPLERRKWEIVNALNRDDLNSAQRSALEQEKKALVGQLNTIDADIKANAEKHGTTSSLWGVTKEELASRMYLNGESEEGAYHTWKANLEAEGYDEARSNADEAIKQIARKHPNMTMREAEKMWFDDLMLESQILRRHGSTETVSVDLNSMGGLARPKVIEYLRETNPDFAALTEGVPNDKLHTVLGEKWDEYFVDIPLNLVLDNTETIGLSDEKTRVVKLDDGSFMEVQREGLGYSAEDFEGWFDEWHRWATDIDLGLSKEDIDKIALYQHELYRNRGKRKAAFDKAYLDFDPASIDPGKSVGSIFGEDQVKAVDFIGTAVNPRFWMHTLDRGAEATSKGLFDWTESETEDRLTGISAERQKLDRIQWAAADFNDEYADEIAAGEMETLAFTEEQIESFDRSLAESVADGVGEFVPTLIELAAITVATRGLGAATGATAAFGRLTALTRLKYGRGWAKALHHTGYLALEEAKMQFAGFKPGSGAAFYGGGILGKAVFRPGALAKYITGNNKFSRLMVGADPLVGATVGTGVIGAASGEIAGITELAWENITGEKDFGLGMQELYGDYDAVTQRLLTNALVFGIAGQIHLAGGKGQMFGIKREMFLITESQKAKFAAKKRKIQIDLIRKNSSTVQEAEQKIKEYEAQINELERKRAEGTISEAEYLRSKYIIEKSIKEEKSAIDKELEAMHEIILNTSGKRRWELGFGRKGEKAFIEDYIKKLQKESGLPEGEKWKVNNAKNRKAAREAYEAMRARWKRARFVYQGMGKNKGKFGMYTELDKYQAAEDAMVSVDAMIAHMKMQEHLNPTRVNEAKYKELVAGGMSKSAAREKAREWDPEFEKKYKETIIDPIDRLIKLMAARKGGEYEGLKVKWLDKVEAKEELGEAAGRYDPNSNTLFFSKEAYMENPDGGIGAHELIHFALRQYFNAHGVQKQLEFQNKIEDAFEREFGMKFNEIFTAEIGTRQVKVGSQRIRDLYGNKLGRENKIVNEEFLAHIAEFCSNPKIYYTKVCHGFLQATRNEIRSFIEESSFGKHKWVSKKLIPEGPKETLKLIARLANDHRRGFDVSGKVALLSRIGELEENANWMTVEDITRENSNTKESYNLSKQQQEINVEITAKENRKRELIEMNTGEGFKYNEAQKAELKNLIPELKELKEELADVDSRLNRHKETQEAVDQYKQAIEADKIIYEEFAKPKIDAEIAELNKEKLGEDEYNVEVSRIEYKYRVVNPNRTKALNKILELHGGYINELRGQYKEIPGSKLEEKDWNRQVDAEVGTMMETYNKEKNDSFAAYLKGSLWRRTGDILKREGIDLTAEFRTQSVEKMKEHKFDVVDSKTASDQLDLAPGGDAIKNKATGVQLVRLSADGKLRKGKLPFTDKAIADIAEKAEALEVPLDMSMDYRNVPDIAGPHVGTMSVPKAKSKKPYIDSNGKKHTDYGGVVQKKANFIANHIEAAKASRRRNLAVDAKGEGTGQSTGAPKSLMGRKRPNEKESRPVYFRDMVGPDGGPVTVKMAKTGEWTRGDKVKGTGAKTGTRLKELIEMTDAEFLAEAGIVDNRTEAQKDRAKEIAQKETLTPEDVKFMIDHGNVDASYLHRTETKFNQKKYDQLIKEGVSKKEATEKATSTTYYDRGAHAVNRDLIGEVSQGASNQAVEIAKQNSPEFKLLDNSTKLIENLTLGKSPLLESRNISKNLSDIWGITEAEAGKYWEAFYTMDKENIPKDKYEYLERIFANTDLKDAFITISHDATLAVAENAGFKSFTGLIKFHRAQVGEGAIPAEILDQAEIASKAFMGDVVIDGKKYKWIDYEALSEHFEFSELFYEQMSGELSDAYLKNLAGDLLGGRRGTNEFAKAFTEQFKPELIESLYNTYRKQGLSEVDAMKKAEERVEKTSAKGKKIYTEATSIINEWSKGGKVKAEFKEFFEKPENQKTGIVRRNKDGSHTEITWTDPILTRLNKAMEKAGTNTNPVFEGINFKEMQDPAYLNKKYNEARLLQEQGRFEEANDILDQAFTKMDEKAKRALYYGTGVVLEDIIRNAEGETKNKAIRFAFRIAKANTNLVKGERALTWNRFFYEAQPGTTKELKQRLIDELGLSEAKAEEKANKAKVEHSLVSLLASFTKASMAAEGRWSSKGKDMAGDYIGIFDVDGRLELIDNATGRVNPSALARMAQLRSELSRYKERVEGEFTGRTLEDVLVADIMAEVKKIDAKITNRELIQPYLRDAVERYKENPDAAARKNLAEAVKEKENIKRSNKKLDKSKAAQELNSFNLSRKEKLDLLKDLSRATANSRKRDKESKGMSTWDFDDTLAKTKSDVLWTAPDGSKGRLNATEFARDGAKLLEQGYKFDFSEFNKVTKGEPGPFLEKALERARKFGTSDTYVLTARAKESAPAIHEFLKSQGLDIPMENIVGLGNSTGAAKARWMLKKYAEGYNDMYFADDALPNVKAVKFVMDRLDIKSKVQQARLLESHNMSKGINEMIERNTGIEWYKKFSGSKARMLGRRRWSKSLVVPGAQDFMGLMQNFMGRGEQGKADRAFFQKHLVDPFARATKEMNEARQRASEDLKALKKKLPKVNKDLNKMIENSAFTHDQAIRAWLWTKSGHKVPELSQKDLKQLIDFVEGNADIKLFAEGLFEIGRGRWSKPSNHWVAETIVSDLFNMNNKERRAEYLTEWIENKNEIFSEENLNKIEATQGRKFREALEDMLYRMEKGTNRPAGNNRLVNQFLNWVNGSVGATMFLNMRSAMLQTISATNYINWGENNMFNAAKAFANQKQYWADFTMIWNSPMLKQRRAGLEYNVQEAELAAALSGQKNKAKAAMAWLIKKGFTPTQVADSFAIAAGGATFFRNRTKMYIKQGLSEAKAKEKAWLDFQEKTESNQQSSRADFISQQQASTLGRIVLAWANTPMQYMRIQEKAFRDIASGRAKGKDLVSAVSKIAYYGAIQSIIFAALQNALFGYGLDEEDDLDGEDWQKSVDRTLNTVVDSQLRGMGIGGAAISALRNAALEFEKQEEKAYDDSYFSQPDHARTILTLTSFSPVLGSKLRKLYSAGNEWNYNRDAINEMGWDIDNPSIDAGANVVEALTNLPVKRVIQKIDNLRAAADSENQMWQRVALIMGYPSWQVGVEKPESIQEAKERGKQKRKQDSSSNQEKEQEFIQQQEDERAKGEETTCAAVNRHGKRCSNKPVGNGKYCTIHQKVDQRADGKKVQCSHIKTDGKRCKMQTSNKSGKCYYHD